MLSYGLKVESSASNFLQQYLGCNCEFERVCEVNLRLAGSYTFETCHNLQAVQVMNRICREAEAALDYYALFKAIMRRAPVPMSPLESLASSAVRTAHKVPHQPQAKLQPVASFLVCFCCKTMGCFLHPHHGLFCCCCTCGASFLSLFFLKSSLDNWEYTCWVSAAPILWHGL